MVKKIQNVSILLTAFYALFSISQSFADSYRTTGGRTTGTGRNWRMEPSRSYRHWQDQDRMSRWKNSPWFATRDQAFPEGVAGNPSVDRRSTTDCPGGVCY